MHDKNVKFQCPQTYFFFLLIDTSDGYSSDNISVALDHGNSNDDGTVTTHSVVQLFFRHHQRMKILINRLLFYPFTPNMSEHGVVVALLLSLVKNTMYLKHVAEVFSMADQLDLSEGLNDNVAAVYTKVFERQARSQLWMILSGMTIIELIENFHLMELQDF